MKKLSKSLKMTVNRNGLEKIFSFEQYKRLINSFSVSKLVRIGEKIVKIHQKMAKLA